MAKNTNIKMRDDRPALISPEGIALMTTAMAFDFIPPVIVFTLDLFFGAGELISWPIDILGTIVLGGWMWMRGGRGGAGKFTDFAKRRLPWVAAEYIPLVGEGPWWTINVFLFLKK